MIVLFVNYSKAQDYIYTYPIIYKNSADLLVKIKIPGSSIYASLDNPDSKKAFSNNELLFENIDDKQEHKLFLFQFDGNSYTSLTEEPLQITMKDRPQIELDKTLYASLTNWSVNAKQTQKLSSFLKVLKNEKDINPLEIISFIQQHRGYDNEIEKDWSFEHKIDAIFRKGEKDINPCKCSYVLNHWATAAPLKPGGGNVGNGYNYIGNNQSQMIADYNDYSTGTPKFHRWYTNEKGPAHDMFLYTYDSGGSFNYEWATFGYDNTGSHAPSPNSAELSYQFFCEEYLSEIPKDCQCTKQLLIVYNYDTYYKVIADKLKPLSKVHSAVEEVAVLSTMRIGYNNPEFEIRDAGKIKVQTKCAGTFNFTWLQNLGNLIAEILGSVSQIYAAATNASGNTVADILDILTEEIPEDIEALINILNVATINVSGDCTDKYGEATLLKGAFYLEMKANEPVFVTLNSYTFLGVYGKKKWNNYAITRSNFRLQGIVWPGSVEKTEECCSDKLGNHLYASMSGPVNDNDLHSWTQGIYALFAPWDNYSSTGYQPAFPIKANRGYFVRVNKEMDCAPAQPFGKTDILGKEDDAIKESNIDDTQNIEKYSINNVAVNLYPNPSNNVLNIEVNNITANELLTINIYDLQGRLISTVYNEQAIDKNVQTSVNLQDIGITSGTYYIFVSQNGIIKEAKPFIYK